MYKTIRHGENSLQYTILPQNDDFRLEGKIKAGGASGSKKSKAKKPKRRSFFAYLGLLFVCTVIIGAVLVPFLVSAECLPNPTEWFLKTKNAFSKKPLEIKENVPTHMTTGSNTIINKGNLALNVGKPVKIINKNGIEKFIIKVNKSSTTEAPKNVNQPSLNPINQTQNSPINKPSAKEDISLTKTPTNEEISITHLSLNDQTRDTTLPTLEANNKPIFTTLKPTTNAASLPSQASTLNDNFIPSSAPATTSMPLLLTKPLSSASVPNIPRASLQSALNQNSNGSSTQPTITTRIMQVPLLKSTAKKPAIPPVLVKNLSPIQPTPDTSNLNDILPVNVNNVKEAKDKEEEEGKSNWIHAHWPFIDPSTYFQWNVSYLK